MGLKQAQGCHPDAAVFNSLMDVLWQSGVVLAQVNLRVTMGCFFFWLWVVLHWCQRCPQCAWGQALGLM